MSDVIFGSYLWNSEKERLNRERHDLAFADAVLAFHDPDRLITIDSLHSGQESHFFCVGRVGGRIATVRFTWRGGRIRLIGAAYWRKGARLYEKTQSDRQR